MSRITIQIGRVETLFLVFLAAYLFSSVLQPGTGVTFLLSVGTIVTFIWVTVRLSRRFAKLLLWRVRNRLLAAYFFIGLVPLVLSLTLVALGAYLVAGQLSIFLIASELDRQTAYLQGPLAFLTRDDPRAREWTAALSSHLQDRYPGFEVLTDNVPANWPDGHGLAVREGQLLGWARVSQGDRKVLATFPITEDYLGRLAPTLGETRMLSLDRQHPARGQLAASRGPDDQPTYNRLPPRLNRFDLVIFSASSVAAHRWDNPEEIEQEYIAVLTRPSALFRTIVTERANFASDWVQVTFYGVAVLFLIALIIALVVGLNITSRITRAMKDLYEGTERVAAGDFKHRIPESTPDQLGALAASFNSMTSNLDRLLEVEKERERLHGELEIAREVQNQLYPKAVPDGRFLRITAVCDPARMVSGDFYDYTRISEDRIGFSLGDVAGKGISAALLMATLQSSFRTQLRMCDRGTGPSELVSQLNKQAHAFTAPEKFATFFFGSFDENASVLTYTNAGHLPPILVRNGCIERLDVNGMVVGAFPFSNYEESSVKMQPGDLLCLFTDGITEPENAYGEMFGEERLLELLRKNSHLPDATLMRLVIDSARQWSGQSELQDDMTVLMVRHN